VKNHNQLLFRALAPLVPLAWVANSVLLRKATSGAFSLWISVEALVYAIDCRALKVPWVFFKLVLSGEPFAGDSETYFQHKSPSQSLM
jgi:hypothetical protein